MNSEPSGTEADIPDEGNVIDIFILCGDDRGSLEIREQLEPQGYRLTLFSDHEELINALREGKPNLLICDATTAGHDGNKICRDIKSDSDLWRIPVLLITGVSDLGDLLGVLDSNADNFIARPYDPQYLLSLVETMLAFPVEKPDPDKIRTQFKIRHDDRDYVIMADRRKLLEFLLSSFEIAVNRAGELAQVQSALDRMMATFERQVADRTSELGTEVARLQVLVKGKAHEIENAVQIQNAQKNEIEALHTRLDDNERVIAAHNEEIGRLTQEIESTRARLAEAEDTVRTLGREKDELEQALRGNAESLNQDLDQTRTELEAAKKEVAALTAHRTTIEGQLAEVTTNYGDTQKALNACSIEIGQLKSALANEKNRAESAEVEVKTVLQEKARAEQELRQMVEDITGKAKERSQECLKLADALEVEKAERASAEQQCSTLSQEAAKKEAAFAAEKGALVEHHEALQQKYDALTESFGAERQKCSSLEAELARVMGAGDELARKFQALEKELTTVTTARDEERHLRTVTETNAVETVAEKDREIQGVRGELAALNDELEKFRSDYTQTRQQLDAALDMHKSLKDELTATSLASVEADKLARSAASETKQIQEELEIERRLHHTAEEELSVVTREKQEIEHRLDTVAEQAKVQDRELEEKIQGLAEALDAERDARALAEDSAAGFARQKEVADQRLQAATEERITEGTKKDEQIAALKADLRAALEHQQVLEEQIKSAAGVRPAPEERKVEDKLRAGRIVHLEEEINTALDRQRSLEEQLRDTERENAEKDAAVQALSRELERAVATLESEKEERLAAEEACSEAKEALAALRKKPLFPSSALQEIPILEHAIVAKQPDLPATILERPHALVRKGSDLPVPVHMGSHEDDSPHARIRTVEDLFEDPQEIGTEDLTDVARSTAGAAGIDDISGGEGEDFTPVRGDSDIQGLEGELSAEEETGDEGSDDQTEESPGSFPQEAGIPTFSRQQWFDLVKWAHSAGTLTHEERLRIVKLGRLIQKGRRLTGRQEAQLAELMLLAHAKGYSPRK